MRILLTEEILSAKEYNFLEYLMLGKETVLSKGQSENHIRSFEYRGEQMV